MVMTLSRRKVEPLMCLDAVYRHVAPFPVNFAKQVLAFDSVLARRSLEQLSRLSIPLGNALSQKVQLR